MHLLSNLLVELAGHCTGCKLKSVYLLLFSLRKQQTVHFDTDRDLVNSLNAIFQELRYVSWKDD